MQKTVSIRINGELFEESVPIRLLLVDFLRERAGLTGTHVACTYEGVCGACTIHLDGEAVKSCLMLAVQADGREITTIEGLARGGKLHALQQAFNDHHALQCGFCTAGILMNMADFLKENPDPSVDEIRHALIGNLCRCTGYAHIVEAVQDAAMRLKHSAPTAAQPVATARALEVEAGQ
jgi:aerobic-type carbon monoxide dehydrogenase small subunit (CoxS/CutS family)